VACFLAGTETLLAKANVVGSRSRAKISTGHGRASTPRNPEGYPSDTPSPSRADQGYPQVARPSHPYTIRSSLWSPILSAQRVTGPVV
jgi:hypothetical protein